MKPLNLTPTMTWLPAGKLRRGDISSACKERIEKDVEEKWCDVARAHGWIAYKFVSPGNRSVPDREFAKRRFVFFIEFKRPGKEATEDQQEEIIRLRKQGFLVLVIDWFDKEFVEFLFAWHD